MKAKRIPWAIASLAVFSTAVHASDLMDAWKAAQQRDPELAAARVVVEQAVYKKDQANALWEPRMGAAATLGVGGQDSRTQGAESNGMRDMSFNTSVNVGALARAQISALKPWISPEREAQSQQLQLSADMADVQWRQAQQALILRTAQRYLDVVAAEQSLSILQRQQLAVNQAAAEITKRQRVGDASMMDVQEAQARVSSVRAHVLNLENNLEMKRLAYRQLVGQSPAQLSTLKSATVVVAPHLADANTWVNRAKQQSTTLQLMQLQQAIEGQEVKRIKAGHAMTVDWVAQAQHDLLSGQGKFGAASNQMTQYMMGIQLQAPLRTNGVLQARELETLKHIDKLRLDQEAVELTLEAQVRDAWQNISSAHARLQALEQADKASKARLLATRNAHRTGARTTLEWLGADQDAAQAELALVQLRIQTLLERLRLYALSSELGEAQLQEINALLQ
jgi:outer membrane protein